jgi:hypothetical protein
VELLFEVRRQSLIVRIVVAEPFDRSLLVAEGLKERERKLTGDVRVTG